jgi:hypothetical protein
VHTAIHSVYRVPDRAALSVFSSMFRDITSDAVPTIKVSRRKGRGFPSRDTNARGVSQDFTGTA